MEVSRLKTKSTRGEFYCVCLQLDLRADRDQKDFNNTCKQ